MRSALARLGFKHQDLIKQSREDEDKAPIWHSGTKGDGTAPQLNGARYFSFEELKRCSDNFSENNVLGEGGFGKVYKGYFTSGVVAAIKRFIDSNHSTKEFQIEIEVLSKVHHKNIVSLVGFCCEQGEQLLVHEYISNGSLFHNLHGKVGVYLDWNKRLQIALDSARGLDYLHELANPPIIHGHVKSGNILLDENLNAKGYLDPEYYNTGLLSKKSDIYGFGIVMLELITARLPVEIGKDVHTHTFLVEEVKRAIDENDHEYYGLRDIIDPTIVNQARNVSLTKFVQLATECLSYRASDRPSMNKIMKEIDIILQHDGSNRTENVETCPSKSRIIS